MTRRLLPLLALAACSPRTLFLGNYELTLDRDSGRFTIQGLFSRLEDVELIAGTGSADAQMAFGGFQFTNVQRDLTRGTRFDPHYGQNYPPFVVPVRDSSGDQLGDLLLSAVGDTVIFDWTPSSDFDRIGLSAACDDDDHFLGLGSHVDVDHVGEAFPLWTSEPGIGKSDRDDVPPSDWPIGGTKHATSFPIPFLVRPHHPDGLLFDTWGRVEVDLCQSDPDRFEMVSWTSEPATFVLLGGTEPLHPVQGLTSLFGRQEPLKPWVFGAWGDAIRGPDRVRTVATELRANDVPATLIWSEDWKGASQTPTGYRLGEEWFLDRNIYPDAEVLAEDLDRRGMKWLAYFAPFVGEGDETWDSAVAADALVKNAEGEPYTFPGVTFQPVGLVDVTGEAGRDWAIARMRDALELGFDGWMADYGEWLPTDAVMADGSTGWEAHDRYPELWQATHREAIEGYDATFFVRSGWTRTASLAPVVWAGDQRTSFDADDGFPTVVPLGLGASMAGVPVFGHDVAGYQSLGNDPSDKELWFRWCELGAFTPVFRLHHGSYDTDNWQFDTDQETLDHYARYAREHVRLYPYLHGLDARASRDGTPMILPVGFVHQADWGRQDAWMLGEALLVQPVMERDARTLTVDLPSDTTWWDWWTLTRATSGARDVPLTEIPVFAAGGTTVPTLATIPDTLVRHAPELVDLAEVDDERVVYLFGGGGFFREADGTRYAPTGAPSGAATVTETLKDGTVSVGGVSVEVSGPRTRTYTFVVP
ncbi:MAG: hypothetical protein KC621_17820 [Myxococcales bacterium]|nr:hypothetical protein [Myxococcales bacterium]